MEKLFSEFPPVTAEEWKKAIMDELKGGDYDKKVRWHLYDGIVVEPFYQQEDLEKLLLDSFPARETYLRGYHAQENKWKIVQHIFTENYEEAKNFAEKALQKGADAVSFRLSEKVDDKIFARLLENIDWHNYAVYFHSFYNYSLLLDKLQEFLSAKGIPAEKVKGGVNFDPFSYFLLHGKYYEDFDANRKELTEIFTKYGNVFPEFKLLQVNGQHFANAGASPIQELGFTLAMAHEYLVLLLENGFSLDEILPKFRVNLSTGPSYFLQIAKFRAARRLWTIILSAYTSSKANSKITWHAISTTYNKTYYDLYNNMLRNTIEAMAAVLGGVDEVTILPHDYLLGRETEFGDRIARNIQLILREEAHFNQVVDPAAGSYYIESLTEIITDEAWKLITTLEDMGGFKVAMEKGFVRDEIDRIHSMRSKDVEQRKAVYVGVNNYPNLREQLEGASEILKSLQKKEKPASPALEIRRGAEPYELLRMKTDAYVAEGHKRPVVLMLQFGNLAMRNARFVFSTNFFGIAGFDVKEMIVETDTLDINQIAAIDPDFVVLCSSDEEYLTVGIKLARQLSETYHVILAGNPGENEQMLREAGVKSFIHIKTNALQALTEYQHQIFSK
jgi:methylmalonyl-CoA mutase